MKIWIDFINTPQVSFFSLLIEELRNSGHTIMLTCRDSGNTVALCRKMGWDVQIVGEKAEKSTFKKLLAFPMRIIKLKKIVKQFKPDIAVCQSSFYLPLTSFLLGIPAIYTNDNEHALGNIPSFLFATKIFIPEYMPIGKVRNQGATKRKTFQYPGVKEGIYLWPKGVEINNQRLLHSPNKIYLRPEPSTAQYYKGNNEFLDSILEKLQGEYEFMILPRDRDQAEHYKEIRFSRIKVCDKPLSFDEIALDCKLFIGAGGSMTREMAIIGVPSISVYQDDLLGVDKYLVSLGILKHEPQLTIEKLQKILIEDGIIASADAVLMKKGRDAYEMIKDAILHLN